MPKVCTVANIRIMRCDYEMWRTLSKGAALKGSRPRVVASRRQTLLGGRVHQYNLSS